MFGLKHNAGLLYSLFYGGQFILLGVQLPFFAGWLALQGFSVREIGWITGAALLARLLLSPAVAYWADHQHDERRSLRVISFLFALGAGLLAWAPGKAVIVIGALLVLWTFGMLVPLTDTAVLSADRNGRLNYGQTRAAGSFFFLSTTILAGWVIGLHGIEIAVWLMMAAAVFAFIISLLLPHGAGGRDGQRPTSWREAPKFLKSPVFISFLAAAGLIQGAHAVYYAFSYLRWAELGYSDLTIGWLWATGVIAEIILLTRSRLLTRRFSPSILLLLGGGAALIRWTLIAGEPPLPLLFAAQTLHAFTFAAAYLGGIEFVKHAAPPRLVNTGMTLMSATGVGAVTGLATVLAGIVWAQSGPAAAYSLMAVMGAIAMVIAYGAGQIWDGRAVID